MLPHDSYVPVTPPPAPTLREDLRSAWPIMGDLIRVGAAFFLIMTGLTAVSPDHVEGTDAETGAHVVMDCNIAALNPACWPRITPWKVALGLVLLAPPRSLMAARKT